MCQSPMNCPTFDSTRQWRVCSRFVTRHCPLPSISLAWHISPSPFQDDQFPDWQCGFYVCFDAGPVPMHVFGVLTVLRPCTNTNQTNCPFTSFYNGCKIKKRSENKKMTSKIVNPRRAKSLNW